MRKIYYKKVLFTRVLKKHGHTVNEIYGAGVDHIPVKHTNLQMTHCM